MRVHRLYHKQRVAIDLSEAWSFLSSPWRLNDITPDFFNIQPTSPVPDQIYAGLMIRYRIQIAGVWKGTWLSEISHCQTHKRFVYDQRAGPFLFLTHEVCFQSTDDGVIVEDLVFYAMPYGLFGEICHRGLIGNRLQAIFQHRSQFMCQSWSGQLIEAFYD